MSFRAITFLGHGEDPRPHEMALHLQNDSDQTYTLSGLRLWTPSENASSHIFEPTLRVGLDPLSSTDRILAPGQIWSQKLEVGSLELGYAIVEAQFSSQGEDEVHSIMAKIRVRREMFDISGGWVSSELDGKSTRPTNPSYKHSRVCISIRPILERFVATPITQSSTPDTRSSVFTSWKIPSGMAHGQTQGSACG